MLAYMDGILDPEDAEDLGRRIEESEQATALLHRIRDVMRRLRLAAPSLTDRGPGLDPNTVAEYLDNTLHESRVTDFEKVCLESDVHLAEVASCHQILAMVLGEAAEIDPAARQRVYELPSLAAAEAAPQPPPVAAGAPSGDGRPADEVAEQKPRQKPTVPDYLREPPKKRRLWPIAAALVALVCVALIVLGALGQFRAGTPLGDALASILTGEQTEQSGTDEPEGVPPQQPAGQTAGQPAGEPAKQPTAKPSEQPRPRPSEEPGPAAPEEPSPEPPVTPKVEPAPKPETPGAEEPKATQPPEAAKGVASLMSEREVLLRFNPQTAYWERVSLRKGLTTGETLLALPTYRPLLALMSANVTLQLIGGTQVVLLPTDAAGVPGLKAEFGRLVMHTVAPEARLRLQVGNRSGVITFADAESVVALEVIPVHSPGTDPQVSPPSMVADLYTSGGQITWDEGGGVETLVVPGGNWVMLSDRPTQAPVPVQDLPKWLALGEDLDSLEKGADRIASAMLARELQIEHSVRFGAGLKLLELSQDSRKENRWLAARCLGYVGEFGPLTAALNDADFPPVWTDESIEYLRAGVARGPETAAQVQEALAKQYGQDATSLYRMLWGYTPAGLREGREAGQLVDCLNHETLAVRTLSFWNLRTIFGLSLSYRPTDREPQRRLHAQTWKQRLESGELWAKGPGGGRTATVEKPPSPEPAPQKP
jgi:hypothetical protein